MNKLAIFTALLFCFAALSVRSQTNEFTYQGRLADAGNAANGIYDLKFTLFSAPNALTSIGPPIERLSVSVVNGVFSVTLDFPASDFDGSDRYVEIAVKSGGGATYTDLSPRQKITSTPYALKSLASETAANADQLGGVAADQFVQTTDSRLSDDRNPLPNSPNYIRNSTTRQTAANINISGTAAFGSHGDFGGVLSTSSNFFVGGNSTLQGNLTVNGLITANLPAGDSSYVQNRTSAQTGTNFNISGTGTASQFNGGNFSGALFAGSLFNSTNGFYQDNVRILGTPGTNNTFAGRLSGSANTGTDNSFFGFNAGNNNTSADNNTFVGSEAGSLNTTGDVNTFLGAAAGKNNILGHDNTFVGTAAGLTNSGGYENTFVGRSAGRVNEVGFGNTFVGFEAGRANTTAFNSFFGYQSGLSNVGGLNNSFFGVFSGKSNTIGTLNAFFGQNTGEANVDGGSNSFFGSSAGLNNTTGDSNTFVGRRAGSGNTSGSNNTAVGQSASVGSGLSYATAIGSDAVANSNDTVVLGRTLDTVRIPGALNVTGAASVGSALNVTGDITGDDGTFEHIRSVTGFIETFRAGLNQGGGSNDLCEATSATGVLAYCSSSIRYKENVSDFTRGLDLIRRLRPVTYQWKTSGQTDVGFIAEEVAQAEPLFAVYQEGKIEGVKYKQLTTVLVNAAKEQQTQIEDQKKVIEELVRENRRQQMAIDALVKAICRQDATAPVCKEQK